MTFTGGKCINGIKMAENKEHSLYGRIYMSVYNQLIQNRKVVASIKSLYGGCFLSVAEFWAKLHRILRDCFWDFLLRIWAMEKRRQLPGQLSQMSQPFWNSNITFRNQFMVGPRSGPQRRVFVGHWASRLELMLSVRSRQSRVSAAPEGNLFGLSLERTGGKQKETIASCSRWTAK